MKKSISKLQRHRFFLEAKDYVMILFSMFLYAIGWTLFLLPNEITGGGVAGISSIIYFGIKFPVQYSYFAINGVLLLIAWRIMGLRFVIKSFFGVCALTLMVPLAQVLESSIPDLDFLKHEPFMASILGGVFCGIGVGTALANNGSSGGTDIIAAIINKYRNIPLGRAILFCDFFIITCSFLVVPSVEKVLFGYVVLFVTTFMVDRVVNGVRQSVQFFIISNKYEEIGKRINKELHRGVTVLDGTGLYTGSNVKMMFVLAKRRESTSIFRLIKEIDDKSFVSQSSVIGVYGEGFDYIKK